MSDKMVGPERNAEPMAPLEIAGKAMAFVGNIITAPNGEAEAWLTFLENVMYGRGRINIEFAKKVWSTGMAVERARAAGE